MAKDLVHEYYICPQCGNNYFKRVYTFSIKLRKVNFSDDPVYNKITEEFYECIKCKDLTNIDTIEEGIRNIKRKWKAIDEA